MTSVYEFSDSGRLRPTGSAELPPAGVNDGVVRWIRMVGPSQHELEGLLRALELPEAVLEALHGGDVRSRVATHNQMLLMSLPVLAPGEVRVLMLWAACTPTTLITAEEEALPAIDRIVTERRNAAPSRLTLLDLFIEVLEAAASNAGPAYLSLRRKLDEFADAVENDPLKVPPDALLAMRRKVAQLSMLWEDQIHGFMEFQRCHSYVLPSDGSRDLLRDLVSDAGRSLKLLARMESRLLDLRQHQLHCLQDSTNRRLNMLAILSAIYLPATLIAGIYGMNFEHIPVTQLRYGYFVVLAIMLLVVLGQLWLFYRRGWFK